MTIVMLVSPRQVANGLENFADEFRVPEPM